MASGVDHQLDGLHRSKLVYKCDVFNRSMAARHSLHLSACLPQSFTRKPAGWPSKETVPSLSRRGHQYRRTSSQADILAKKNTDTPTPWPHSQPTPPMAIQDLPQASNHGQYSEYENHEHPKIPMTDAEWLDSTLGLHSYGQQQQAFILPELHLLDGGKPLQLEQTPSQEMMLGQMSNSLWPSQTHDINGSQPNLQDSPGRPSVQGAINPHPIPPLAIPISEQYTFPLTPPSSTRSDGASPTEEVVDSHQHVMNDVLHLGFDVSMSRSSGPSIPRTDVMVPTPSPYPFSGMTWPNEEFAKFLQPGLFPSNMDPLDHGSTEHPVLSSGWEYNNLVLPEDTGQTFMQTEQGPWLNAPSDQPSYSNSYPSIPLDVFDQTSAWNNPIVALPNCNFDITQQSLQAAASSVKSSLFDGLSPDIDSPTAGRRSGTKANQRATAKDRELIRWKNQGLSYKEIKARGGFNEAESTLRGRYRTLTKPKHLRVRKPEWQQKDV